MDTCMMDGTSPIKVAGAGLEEVRLKSFSLCPTSLASRPWEGPVPTNKCVRYPSGLTAHHPTSKYQLQYELCPASIMPCLSLHCASHLKQMLPLGGNNGPAPDGPQKMLDSSFIPHIHRCVNPSHPSSTHHVIPLPSMSDGSHLTPL